MHLSPKERLNHEDNRPNKRDKPLMRGTDSCDTDLKEMSTGLILSWINSFDSLKSLCFVDTGPSSVSLLDGSASQDDDDSDSALRNADSPAMQTSIGSAMRLRSINVKA